MLSSDTDWRAGVYRLCGIAPDGPRGTAFGVGPRLALTCHHCVDGVDPACLVLQPATIECAASLQVAEVLFPGDPRGNDVAILRMADDLPAWLPASAKEPPERVKLLAFGYPGSTPRQPLVRIEVESRGLQPAEYAQYYRLDVALILAKDPAAHGMSGGPIIEAESGAAVAMIVGGPDFDGRTIALPLWEVSSVERPWNAFDQAIAWSAASTEQAGWVMNGRAATSLCKRQVGEAVGRLTQRGNFEAARYVSRPAFERAVVSFLSGTKPTLLLTGAANVGKTSALASLAERMAGRALLLDGFHMDRLRQPLIEHVHEQLTKLSSGIDAETVHALCQALRDKDDGELVILVDGLNEAGASASELRTWLSEATSNAKELGCRLIMSCRSDYAHVTEIDESQTEVFALSIFSEREAYAASLAYGIEAWGAGVMEHHPLMFRIAARSPNPNKVFQQGRHRAIRSFVQDTVARCTGVTAPQVNSIVQGCSRVADHGGADDDSVDVEFAANQVGGLQRLESLIEGGVFKAQDNRIRFFFDEVAACLRSPLEGDYMELGVLWRRSMKDQRIAMRVANSLVACEARGDETRLSEHVESLLAALAEGVADEIGSVYLWLFEGDINSILCTLTDALPSSRTDITERIMKGFREAFVEAARTFGFGCLPSRMQWQAATLQIPWKQKGELLVHLLPMLSDLDLRTKDLLDRGHDLHVKADAEDPTTVVGALSRLILDHSSGMRELLLPQLDDGRRLMRDDEPCGEVSVGELICSLLLITATIDPDKLIELLFSRPDSRAASALLGKVAAAHPDIAMDFATSHLDRTSTIVLLKDVIDNSLRSVGPGRAPRVLLGKLRTILCEATPDIRLIAASLIRECEPEDLDAWDAVAHAVAISCTRLSMRPVPGARRKEFMQVLRARADRYALEEMESEDDAQLQEPMAGLAMDMLSRSASFPDTQLGYLAEKKANRVDKHPAFAPWLEFILRVAGHPDSEVKGPLVYLMHFRWDRPDWPDQIWSVLVGGSAESSFVCQLVIRVVTMQHGAASGQLMRLLRVAMRTRPEETLKALSKVAFDARRKSELFKRTPPGTLDTLFGLVVDHLRREPVASWPSELHSYEPSEALRQFALLHASDDE